MKQRRTALGRLFAAEVAQCCKRRRTQQHQASKLKIGKREQLPQAPLTGPVPGKIDGYNKLTMRIVSDGYLYRHPLYFYRTVQDHASVHEQQQRNTTSRPEIYLSIRGPETRPIPPSKFRYRLKTR